jgi:hypothetical protein
MARHTLVRHHIEDAGVRAARLQLDQARAAWHQHVGSDAAPSCLKCYIVGETRRGAAVTDLCPVGQVLRTDRDNAAAHLRDERAQAAKPVPGQQALFDLPERGPVQ